MNRETRIILDDLLNTPHGEQTQNCLRTQYVRYCSTHPAYATSQARRDALHSETVEYLREYYIENLLDPAGLQSLIPGARELLRCAIDNVCFSEIVDILISDNADYLDALDEHIDEYIRTMRDNQRHIDEIKQSHAQIRDYATQIAALERDKIAADSVIEEQTSKIAALETALAQTAQIAATALSTNTATVDALKSVVNTSLNATIRSRIDMLETA